MKKLTAILLCIMCLVSSVALSASAEDSILTKVGSILGLESSEEEVIGYGLTYDSNKFLSGVSGIMYEPKPTVTIINKGTYTVTDDIPLAIDYQFVCWQDKDTGKLYYAGDKYYIDGQKTFYAVWEEKTDGYSRPIRVFLTAMETFKRSIMSFFGVFKVEYEEEPTADVWFDLEDLVKHDYEFAKDTRTFNFKVKLENNTPFFSFSRTEDIFLGGEIVKIEKKVLVDAVDADGNPIKDENGKTLQIEKKIFINELQGSKKYSALYETRGAEDVVTENGESYQIISVTLTDGVPKPLSSVYVTFVIPKGVFRYKDASGVLHSNEAYNYRVLTWPNLE